MKIIIECAYCKKEKETNKHFQVTFEDGYCDYCSKKCAIKDIKRNIDSLILKIET